MSDTVMLQTGTGVRRQINRFADAGSLASAADRAACSAAIRQGSRSFALAGRLLPAALREDAFALYGFCRQADDLIDAAGAAEAGIAALRHRLDRAYAGRPEASAIDRAFADTVRRHKLPRALPEALIDGLAMDVAGVTCADLAALQAYAARVAGSVGAMFTILLGVRDAATLARACDLGMAMQLSNIARDVGEDARAGRLYLPRDWLAAAGVDVPGFMAAPHFSPQLAAVVAQVLEEAENLYRRAAVGIQVLPAPARPGITAASLLYREIGRVVARAGFDTVSARARVGGARKILLLARGLASGAPRWLHSVPPETLHLPPLPAAQFLVDEAAASPAPRTRHFAPWSDRIVWAADLLARLETRNAAAQVAPP